MNDYSIEKSLRLREVAPDELSELQTTLLRSHLCQAIKSPYYRRKLKDFSIKPEDIVSIDDLSSLPLTERDDLNEFGDHLLAVKPLDIADISITSGTTGAPVKIPYSVKDLERLAFNETMAFWGAGVRPGDVCLICVTLDRCFIAGLAYYTGLVRLGAAAIRSGAGQPARQWELISQLHPQVLVGVPTFLLKIAQWAAEHGHDPSKAGIKKLVTIGEPVRRADFRLTPLGEALVEVWQSDVYSSYGATELETGFCECYAGLGGHVHPEMSLVEIVNEQGKVVPNGEPGELVFTPLGVEAFPLVRFKTGDITRKYETPCECGWKTIRIGPIEGRVAQRLKLRGTTIYPESIFHVLQEIDAIKASYVEVRSGYDLSDQVRVIVGTESDLDAKEVERLLQARLRVRPEVAIQKSESVIAIMTGHGGRKPKRFFDLRSENN